MSGHTHAGLGVGHRDEGSDDPARVQRALSALDSSLKRLASLSSVSNGSDGSSSKDDPASAWSSLMSSAGSAGGSVEVSEDTFHAEARNTPATSPRIRSPNLRSPPLHSLPSPMAALRTFSVHRAASAGCTFNASAAARARAMVTTYKSASFDSFSRLESGPSAAPTSTTHSTKTSSTIEFDLSKCFTEHGAPYRGSSRRGSMTKSFLISDIDETIERASRGENTKMSDLPVSRMKLSSFQLGNESSERTFKLKVAMGYCHVAAGDLEGVPIKPSARKRFDPNRARTFDAGSKYTFEDDTSDDEVP